MCRVANSPWWGRKIKWKAQKRVQNWSMTNELKVSTCSKCGGEGKIITAHCRKCGGQGKVQSKRGIKVVIPPGVDDGATMVVRGEGNFDQKRGVSGDLYLVLHVDGKHGIWRDGLNLYSRVNIDYTEAILGTLIKVETAEGSRDLQIPSGIQPGDTVKMSKMGVPDINKPFMRGDHYFIVNVRIPTAVRRRQSGSRFASVSVNTAELWRCNRPTTPFMISSSTVFILTVLFTLVSKTESKTNELSSSADFLGLEVAEKEGTERKKGTEE
ncbi:hypothetical protein RJ639_029988 [Escallonia herrerae]|uniref:Chaperone DnaJ C-terminal domain-containing protein n=1 Tax=Escallonia herrerae TaxID=1293975 RepID=A0AA88X0L9_9ASTE|nr:hypothetical protein RJ639_029988 [Escallonia herrerae]